MFKPRNILIILMLQYLVMVIVCAFIEFFLVDVQANNIKLMIQTAGDMALEQVLASDDFFVEGQSYLLEENKAYSVLVLNSSGKFEKANVFQALTDKYTLKEIHEVVYSPYRIQKFISENPSVLDVEMSIANFRYDGDSFVMKWYKVPVLAQMGRDRTGADAIRGYDSVDGGTVASFTATTNVEITNNIWKNYGFNTNEHKVQTALGEVSYFISPLNIGITYLNEDLLQAFFMTNMDLLMRSKYMQNAGYNLNSEQYGNGMLKGVGSTHLISDTLNNMNPINNGSFTLLRGQKMPGTQAGYDFYVGIKPKIEYMVVDMYATDNGTGNGAIEGTDSLLKLVLGGKITDSLQNGTNIPVLTTGANLKELGKDLKDPMTNNGSSMEPYNHKPIVIAKVTFYADVVVPFSTLSLREMRGNVNNDGTLSGRTLFSTGRETAQADNFLDIRHKLDLTGFGGYNPLQGVTGLQSYSDPMIYTTYFAVTP